MSNRFIRPIANSVRNLSSSAQKSAETEVVLLHFGQPWTEFYAKEFLHSRAALFYNVPNFLKSLIRKDSLTNDKIKGCIAAYGEVPSLEDQIDSLAPKLESSLSSLVPEFGSFKVTRLFYFDQQSISDRLDEMKIRRSQNVIFLPLYSHYWCAESGSLLSQVAEHINKTTVPIVRENRDVQKSRVAQNSDYSFNVSTIHRWNDHPFVSQYWANKIEKVLPEIDGVVFAVPRKTGYNSVEFERSVWATCDRVMNHIAHSVPWRLSFYNSWDSWDVPCKHGVKSQVSKLAGLSSTQKIAVVPVTDIFETFDTLHVLPQLVSRIPNTLLLNPDRKSETVVQGLSEVIKNHLLGRPHRQLEVKCDRCLRKDCAHRDLFSS